LDHLLLRLLGLGLGGSGFVLKILGHASSLLGRCWRRLKKGNTKKGNKKTGYVGVVDGAHPTASGTIANLELAIINLADPRLRVGLGFAVCFAALHTPYEFETLTPAHSQRERE
jgi:hypothetical protein